MEKKIAILLIFILILQACMSVYATPPSTPGYTDSYEDVEAGSIFQGQNPLGDYYNMDKAEYYNDYYRSIMYKGKYRNKDTGAALTDSHLPDASFSWTINTTSTAVKKATGTTSNSRILDLGTIYVGDTITFSDKSTNGSAAAGNSIQNIYMNVTIRQNGYSYNAGQRLSVAPRGNVSYKADKPGVHLVSMQSMSGPYLAWFQSHSGTMVPSDIWSANGAHHSWGEKQFGDISWSGWSHFVGVTFRVQEKDTKTPIADIVFSDTDDTVKYIYLGESFTIIDKSYAITPGATIVGYFVQVGSGPATYITNPDTFFKDYKFLATGTYKITLHYVHDSNNAKSENSAKTLTVIVSQKPQPGQGKVIYEYYKESVKPENLQGTNEVGISNPYVVVLPESYGDGLKFSSATYSGEAVSTGGSCKNGDSIAITDTTKDLTIQAIYKAGATGPTYDPPTAIIDAPDTVMAGESMKADGKRSHSNNEGGSIVAYYWDYEGANLVRNNNSNINIWYPQTGSYTIFLDVEDEMGNTEWIDHEVTVTPPIPTAVIKYTGKLKENRKITLDSSDSTSPTYYPIDTTKIVWQITPVSGGTASDVKYEGVLNGNITKDILFKKAGTYKVRLTVTNTYGRTASTETTLIIQPDLPPIAKLVLPAPEGMIYQLYREPTDANYARFEVYNESSSPDGDIINKAIAFYCYDSDNDGNYQEETWYYSKDGTTWLPVGMTYAQMVSNFNIYNIATSNVPKWTLRSNQVGKYYFAIRVMETIPADETIPAFITENDYKRADSFN